MKIAILGPYFYPVSFGIEKVMYAHAKYLAERGHQVTVVSSNLSYPTGRLMKVKDREIIDGFQIIRRPVLFRSFGAYLAYPSNGGVYIPGLSKILKQLAPDVVHAHNVGAPAWAMQGALYCRKYNKKFFYSLYSHPSKLKFETFRKFLLRKMNNIPLRQANKIFFQTEFDGLHAITDFSIGNLDRIAVLENGVSPPNRSHQIRDREQKVQLLFVGRVEDKRKGFDVLEAALDVLDEPYRSGVTLRVIGTISDARRQSLFQKFGERIVVSGNVDETQLELAYSQADIFVMPSYFEGFGMPFVEAMRYGLAVIGTATGGVPYVVPENTGILVAPGDPLAVKDALITLIKDRSFLKYGENGKIWSKKFEWPAVVSKLEAFYAAS